MSDSTQHPNAPNFRVLYAPAIIFLATVLGQYYGLGFALLVVAAGVLAAGIWLLWQSLGGLSDTAPMTLEEALSLGAPSAEEEQKRAVLRALKDLEYERAVGKINDKDYRELSDHYRSEAKRLLQLVDESLQPERQRAEEELAKRLAKEAAVASDESSRREPAKGEDDRRDGAGAADDEAADAGEEPASSPGKSTEAPQKAEA